MTPLRDNFSNRERKTIILLSVVAVFSLGILVVLNLGKEQQPQPSESSAQTYQKKKRQWQQEDSAYKQKMAERRQRQDEHYRLQAEHYSRQEAHYRLQDEYYRQKDKFYRDEIKRIQRQSAQQAQTAKTIRTTDSTERPKLYDCTDKFQVPTTIDANTADSATLCRIPGIGKTIASIILRQRNRLGGFHSLSQLCECKYFTEDLLPWFTISAEPELKKICINTATFYQLVSHPYISKAQTQDILAYIRRYGNIKDAGQLRSTGIFTEEELPLLLPYLEF